MAKNEGVVPEIPQPEHKMPQSFWTQPGSLMPDESVQLIYAEVKSQLETECEDRGGSVLDFMLAERCAALYGHIRQRETGAGFANDRARKETLQLWVMLATTLKKQWSQEDSDKQSEVVARKVTTALAKTLEAIPAEHRKAAQDALQLQLAEAGL